MAKFIYRMQSVLNIKEKLEEQAKNEFALASQRLNEELEKLEQLENRQEEYRQEGVRLREDILDPLALQENVNALEYIKQAIIEQQKRVKAAVAEMERARKKLQECMIERKTHERLREKAFEEFKVEVNKQESKEVDELVSYVYGRKAIQGDS